MAKFLKIFKREKKRKIINFFEEINNINNLKNMEISNEPLIRYMNQLEDKDLFDYCQNNKEALKICNNQIFWFDKIRKKFSYIPQEVLNENKTKYHNSWSDYYINDLSKANLNKDVDNLLIDHSREGRLDLVMISLNNGADIHNRDNEALRLASRNNHQDIVKYLIKNDTSAPVGTSVTSADTTIDKNPYDKIINIYSLSEVLLYLKSVKNPKDLAVWLDWDETIINSNKDTLLEPYAAKELFKYMIDNGIFFSIITGRFYDTACEDNKRLLGDMYYNIVDTIYPTLNMLGANTNKFMDKKYTNTIYKIFNEKGVCKGILYMGIIFSGDKGETIKNYLRQTGIKKKINVFVDDYEPYLYETTKSMPSIVAFRKLDSY